MSRAPILIHVFDSYCGWSYGMAPALVRAWQRHRHHVEFQTLHGSLFSGSRAQPLGRLDFIPDANRRVAKLTGVRFGEGFQRLYDEGSFVLDSDAAARGYVALRDSAPELAVPLVLATHEEFFVHGRPLGTAESVGRIAEAVGTDPDAAIECFEAEIAGARGRHDTDLAASLPVDGYPALLLAHDDRLVRLNVDAATSDRLGDAIARGISHLTAA